MCLLFVVTKLSLVWTLCFAKGKTRLFINFELGSQIVQLTSALLFLRSSGDSKPDWLLSISILVSTGCLFVGILITSRVKGWWGLHLELREKRSTYATRHQKLMENPSIENLTDLEKEFNQAENRFEELPRTFGRHELYPSIVGFDRSVYYMLFKVAKPLPFAIILVFVDSNWIAILCVPCLFVGYFCLQMIIGAK